MNKKYNLYLSGGGDREQAFKLEKEFFTSINPSGRLLYLPVALKGHPLFAGASIWFKELVAVHGREDLELITLDKLEEKSIPDLSGYDGIFIGGGNTWSLAADMATSGFSSLIVDYAASGKPLYGGSAGAIVLGKMIDAQDDPNDISWNEQQGLALLDELSITCHYKETDFARYHAWANSKKTSLLCLPEDSGLIISNGQLRIIGYSPVQLFDVLGNNSMLLPIN